MKKITKKQWKIIAMVMAMSRNIPVIELALEISKMTPLQLASAGNIVKTAGDPLAGSPPVTDAVTHAQAGTLETTYNGTQTKPPTTTSAQVKVAFKTLATTYKKVAAYVLGVANDAAITAGDVNAGIEVATRCGFRVKKAKAPFNRHFKATPGIGCCDITTKAVAKRAVYVRQYGPTTAKGVPPSILEELLISTEADIHISNLKSAGIYAFREAYVLPLKRPKKTSSTTVTIATAKTTTPTVATTSKKVTFNDGAEHYTFGDWIYVVIL
ncbi:MAG: hypothetical protein ABR968_06995 [Bacteroidales bacterium]|jgi:hypothetical protein